MKRVAELSQNQVAVLKVKKSAKNMYHKEMFNLQICPGYTVFAEVKNLIFEEKKS